MLQLVNKAQDLLDKTCVVDFLPALFLRLYLAPVFWFAGTNKVGGLESWEAIKEGFGNTAAWFGNPDWGLGLPLPGLMAFLAITTEILGAIMLLFGFGVRWVSAPLMFTMFVAIVTVHWHNGWQAVADAKSPWASENIGEAQDRLSAAQSILQEHGNYSWLTGSGDFVILNNGIEWATTYFLMLLVLFFIGAGKYASADYWIAQKYRA